MNATRHSSASSVIASGFPSGGIDMRLNAKSMAVVDTEHARDRLKQALQLRASSLPIETVAERPTSVNVQHGVGTRKVLKVVKSNRSVLKSHVRQLPTPLSTQEVHQQLVMSSTEEPSTVSPTTQEAIEVLEEVGSSIDLETTSDESVETTSTTTYAPAPTTSTSSTSTTSTQQPVSEDFSDNEIEEEVVVVSDTIVIRLPHETFVTGCNKNDQC
ncbi:hypothetical protein GCK32_000721 [Trichostrongylus colubriformis]|uniref:Uncharacterized protein n=1 Tax=Trichostrongylus colubriformis TaxID=6319 RepID=A0AAN8FMY3_TRICO